MGTTESLAQWIVATSYTDIPAAAYDQAKKSILDFLGTAIQGSTTHGVPAPLTAVWRRPRGRSP